MLIPSENEKDLAEVPENVKAGLKIIPMSTVDDALLHALAGTLPPIEWNEDQEPLAAPKLDNDGDETVMTH